MANIKVGKKEYWYRQYRMSKTTDKKLKQIKKKVGKNWNGVFEELMKLFNQQSRK